MGGISDSSSSRRGVTPDGRRGRQITALEALAVLIVIAAVVAMAVWFLFFSSGGIGPGTV